LLKVYLYTPYAFCVQKCMICEDVTFVSCDGKFAFMDPHFVGLPPLLLIANMRLLEQGVKLTDHQTYPSVLNVSKYCEVTNHMFSPNANPFCSQK
jgi:hypothetical protein